VSAVVDAAVRGFDLVVVDVPRYVDAAAELVLSRCDMALVVTSNRIRATAAAARLVDHLDGRSGAVRLVVRMDPRGLREDAIQTALAVPVVGRLPVVPSLVARADDGEAPAVGDAYGKACAAVLRELPGHVERAA
jgi:Flp pilus assembly CpaE family ATPase